MINNRSAAHLNGTEIGEPPAWTFLADPSSPYYIDEDTFYDINKTIATVTRIKSIHNCKTNHPLPLPSNAPLRIAHYCRLLTRQFRSVKRAHEWEIRRLGPPRRQCHQASPVLFHSFEPADLHHPRVSPDALSRELRPPQNSLMSEVPGSKSSLECIPASWLIQSTVKHHRGIRVPLPQPVVAVVAKARGALS